jgi:hypothetical protein
MIAMISMMMMMDGWAKPWLTKEMSKHQAED